jgi:SAM-dependent methyltransferase
LLSRDIQKTIQLAARLRSEHSREYQFKMLNSPAASLRKLLAHPITAGLSLDAPQTTELQKQIIDSKPFLKAIYDEWYRMLAAEVPPLPGQVLELGSGAGHCERYIPQLITSNCFYCAGVQLVTDAQYLPFADGSLRAIVFTDVLHHIPDVRRFFAEASRCLRPGGKVVMIEPWVTPWSRFVWKSFHHEPFCPEAKDWSITPGGPLSGANDALPWIVFSRDRETFLSEFPQLAIGQIRPFLPFRYLVSGGISMRSLMPGFTHSWWARLERLLERRMSSLAMFAFISLQKS